MNVKFKYEEDNICCKERDMKYGGHQNYCNGPGDCSCGEDYREFAAQAVRRYIEDPGPDELQAEVKRLKEQVRYWKHKAGVMK